MAALGCGDDLGPRDVAGAVLEPDEQGFVLSVWRSAPGVVAIEVRTGDVVVHEDEVELGASPTAAVAIDGLAAAADHEITLSAANGPTRTLRARTAPLATDPRPVRLAVSADYDPHPMFETDLVAHVLAAEPELFVSLGDFPYTDNGPPAMTVDAYRSRHALGRSAREARRLFEGVGVRAIYDDHEFRNDWDAMRAAEEPARYAAAVQVWDEFFPVRAPIGDVRYRSWRWGAHLECFLLDCRRFRSANAAPDGPGKEMLGAAQHAWLAAGLQASTATFKLVLTSVPLDFGLGVDHWIGFTDARARLYQAIAGVPGVLFVSADQHYFAAHRHANGAREIQVGPLARGVGEVGRADVGVWFRSQQLNAAVLDVSAEQLVIAGLGAGGERFYEEALTPADLTVR